jgi:hypothetical protein
MQPCNAPAHSAQEASFRTLRGTPLTGQGQSSVCMTERQLACHARLSHAQSHAPYGGHMRPHSCRWPVISPAPQSHFKSLAALVALDSQLVKPPHLRNRNDRTTKQTCVHWRVHRFRHHATASSRRRSRGALRRGGRDTYLGRAPGDPAHGALAARARGAATSIAPPARRAGPAAAEIRGLMVRGLMARVRSDTATGPKQRVGGKKLYGKAPLIY